MKSVGKRAMANDNGVRQFNRSGAGFAAFAYALKIARSRLER